MLGVKFVDLERCDCGKLTKAVFPCCCFFNRNPWLKQNETIPDHEGVRG